VIEAPTLGTATIRRYSAGTFVVALGVGGVLYKLFQVVFTAKDGSVFVAFPYFRHAGGIVAELPTPARAGGPTTASLPVHGWKTTNRVKYSHHVSGHAQFSPTKRFRSDVRKQAVPLADVNGHLFTLYLKGVTDFERLKRPKDLAYPQAERTTVLLNAPAGDPGWFRLVGRWYTLDQFVARHRAATGIVDEPLVVGPLFADVGPRGREPRRILLSPPPGTPSADSLMELSVEGIGDFDPASRSTFLFLGGFDRSAVSDGDAGTSTYLALKHPARNAGEIWRLMRSIDLPAS
jgi:hypothetical protein